MNKLTEMLKVDRDYFQRCMNSALDYDCNKSLITYCNKSLLTYYSTLLKYIDSLMTRMGVQVKEGGK